MTGDPLRRSRGQGIRKRAPNACVRCRQQKIKCSGKTPCEQCTKRNLACTFDDATRKVTVTRSFINELERRASGLASHDQANSSVNQPDHAPMEAIEEREEEQYDSSTSDDQSEHNDTSLNIDKPQKRATFQDTARDSSSGRATPTNNLTNPFSSNAPRYIADETGRPYYLGVSSNWAFSRRILSMAHERVLGAPYPTATGSFDSRTYDLGWNGLRGQPSTIQVTLPSSDYAIYLINSVKFRCGQIFHLFDEESFMQHFWLFHEDPEAPHRSQDLWYVHYLIVLAFGKALVAKGNSHSTPSGSNYFVKAMQLLPDIIFLHSRPLESVETLCCAALYLQCLDFRCPAYNMIGQALRILLAEGMHTSMQDQNLNSKFVQRARSAWWTVYVLDRQMSSLMGVPLAIRDEDIDASLPTYSGSVQKTLALEYHVKLSRMLSQILSTVYGTEGRLNRRFISCTKAALRNIASVTDELKRYFPMPREGSISGISRLAAYLHLLLHQCVVLAIRPLVFSFLRMKLDKLDTVPAPLAQSASGNAKVLLHMCIESARQILDILAGLQSQHLLETFLPFDLEAAFAAAMVLLLVPTIDTSILESHIPSTDIAYAILDEMIIQNNLAAINRKSELQQLESLLNQIPFSSINPIYSNNEVSATRQGETLNTMNTSMHNSISHVNPHSEHQQLGLTDETILGDHIWSSEFTADQLMMVADSLDIDGLDWSIAGSSNNPLT